MICYIRDRLLKWHGPIHNCETKPIVAVFGQDGPLDDWNKCFKKIRPGESHPAMPGYHIDWLIMPNCRVTDYWGWFPLNSLYWDQFERDVGSTEQGRTHIERIREAFRDDAPPPCGSRNR